MRYLIGLVLLCVTHTAMALEIKREDLYGLWAYETTYNLFPDGSKSMKFGDSPKGRFAIFPNGQYSHIIAYGTKTNRFPKRVSPPLIHWGTFSVNEKNGSFTGRVEWSSDSSLLGRNQLRTIIQLDKHILSYTNHLSIAGGNAKVIAVLRRLSP